MLERTKYMFLTEKESFFKTFDNLDNDRIKIKNVEVVIDGEKTVLESKDYYKIFDLSGKSTVIKYVKEHPEELVDMLSGTHKLINFSGAGIWSTGKVAFFFDDQLSTGNYIWLNADVLPSFTLEGKGSFISIVTRYDIAVKREENVDGVMTQSVQLKEYFGDNKLSVIYRTGWAGEQTIVNVTQYDGN